MSFVEIRAQLPTEQLLKAVDQLDQTELDDFVRDVIALRARRQAPSLSKTESELLLKINRAIPSEIQDRYDELIAKRRQESLTSSEYDELLQLTDQVEKLEAERVADLADLARLRQVSLSKLLTQLDIQAPAYA